MDAGSGKSARVLYPRNPGWIPLAPQRSVNHQQERGVQREFDANDCGTLSDSGQCCESLENTKGCDSLQAGQVRGLARLND
jgi:hypothetical protein